MRILGNFKQTGNIIAPVLVIGVFDSVTNLPSFALVQESDAEVPLARINGTQVIADPVLSDFSLENTRPQEGGGILRQTASLSLLSEHAKGYPFVRTPISKAFYYGGQSVNDYYFGVWIIDRRNQFLDVTLGCFLGYFKIDASAKWQEKDGVTTLSLIDVLLQDTNKVGATDEAIPDQLFIFNPWYNAPIVPKVFGQVPRVKTLNLFPTISIKKASSAISGQVQSNYTNASATIDLEKYADTASVLRQLITIGGNVRIRMHDGEVILGSLAYNSGTGIVTLTVVTRNTYYGTAKGYTFPGNGQTPSDWGTSGNARDQNKWPGQWNNSQSVILNGSNVVQDANGYMRASIKFYDAGQVSKYVAVTVATKLKGWVSPTYTITADPAAQTTHGYNTYVPPPVSTLISHEPWVSAITGPYPALSTCGLSTNFNANIVPDPLISYAWAPGAYVYFDSVPKAVELWFNNPDTAVAGSGSIGDPWTLVAVEPASVDYSCVLRNGFSHFTNDHVFGEGDNHLIKIPTSHIVSVSDSGTVLGLANMMKITLDAAPMDMVDGAGASLGFTSNVVYVDALYKTAAGENRSERIVYEIIKESAALQQFCGGSISTPANYFTTSWMPYCGVLVREVKTVVEILDRLLFQLNATFQWQISAFEIRETGVVFNAESDVTISGHTYTYPNFASTDAKEMVENSAEFSCGQILTVVDANGYEYIPMYYDVAYGGWEDPFYKPSRAPVNRGIKQNQRLFQYKFDYINDMSSANFAIGASLCIGHQSGLACIERMITTDMITTGIRWEACDPIVFQDFPMLSTSDETNANLDAFGHPRYLKPSDNKKFLMGAVGEVDRVQLKCQPGESPLVMITAKLAQTYVQASGMQVYLPPYPPNAPPSPPTDPSQPPGQGGGTQGANSYGGDYTPMQPKWTQPADVTINSLSTVNTTMDLTVESHYIWNEGWSWTAEAIANDGAGVPVGAVTISPASGSFGDKVNDSYSPTTYNLTIGVTSAFLIAGAIVRQLTIRFTRTILVNAHSSMTYTDTFDVSLNVFLSGPTDIVAS